MSIDSPVLILGAGIAGLTFAQGLRLADIPFRIFERDAALNVRSQGYRFRIFGDHIQYLRACVTLELWRRLEGTFAEFREPSLSGVSHTAPVSFMDALTGEEDPTMNTRAIGQVAANYQKPIQPIVVDRCILRDNLFAGLEEHVEFGKVFSSYDILPDGVSVSFGDGTKVIGSILVGADGRYSKIKKQLLPTHVSLDTEFRWLFGRTTITPEVETAFNKHAQQGMSVILDHSRDNTVAVVMEPMRFMMDRFAGEKPSDYLYWALCSFRKETFDSPNFFSLSPAEAEALTTRIAKDWHPSFQALFKYQDPGRTSPLQLDSAHPDLPPWASSRVTLIGDSIHAMSPTGGSGAGTAIRDAAVLSSLLHQKGVNVQAIGEYESQMRQYAAPAISRSLQYGELLFGARKFSELKPVATR